MTRLRFINLSFLQPRIAILGAVFPKINASQLSLNRRSNPVRELTRTFFHEPANTLPTHPPRHEGPRTRTLGRQLMNVFSPESPPNFPCVRTRLTRLTREKIASVSLIMKRFGIGRRGYDDFLNSGSAGGSWPGGLRPRVRKQGGLDSHGLFRCKHRR